MNTLKVAIWTLAIVGMAPAILLAVLNLSSNIALARHLKNNADQDIDGSEFATFQSYMEFGSRYHLEVTNSYWPSVSLLVGAGAFVVGLLYLIPPQTQVRRVGGFEKIEKYVEQVMNSRSPHAYLVISSADDEYTAVTVSKEDDDHSIDFYLTKKEQIAPVLFFFAERGVEPASDYVIEEGTEFEGRNLSFPVQGNTQEVSKLCESILADAYGVERNAELVFTLGG